MDRGALRAAARHPVRTGRHGRSPVLALAAAATIGLVALWRGGVGGRRPRVAVFLGAASSEAASDDAAPAAPQLGPCEQIRAEIMESLSPKLTRWERYATDGQTIHGYGAQATKLLNRTLETFDARAEQRLGNADSCVTQREELHAELERQLHSIFLAQRSAIEQVLFQRLKKELLRRMRRKKAELPVKEKLKLLHSSMAEYDMQVRDLMPAFVDDSERDRAERRLSELQWGILDTPEGKELQQRWKMDRLRRMPMHQSRGLSVSLSPGMRVMFRPGGFGNIQLYSRRQVGPPHNPNEVAIGLLNDGEVMDVYNQKPKPPLVKFQPTVAVDMSVG